MPKLPQGEVYEPVMFFFGTLQCVSITSLNQDAHLAKNADSDTLRLMGIPAKSRRKVVVYTIGLILMREIQSYGKKENSDRIAPSKSPRARGTT